MGGLFSSEKTSSSRATKSNTTRSATSFSASAPRAAPTPRAPQSSFGYQAPRAAPAGIGFSSTQSYQAPAPPYACWSTVSTRPAQSSLSQAPQTDAPSPFSREPMKPAPLSSSDYYQGASYIQTSRAPPPAAPSSTPVTYKQPYWSSVHLGSKTALEIEKCANRFSNFYQKTIRPPHDKSCSAVQALLKSYKHADALHFAAATRDWNSQESQMKKLSPLEPTEQVSTFASESQVCAFYRVIAEGVSSYTLVACHVNVHGLHRGDLRFLVVNQKTEVKGMEGRSVVGHLFRGDIVAVTELAIRKNFKQKTVLEVNQESDCPWLVKRMTILTRQIMKDCVFGFIENGTAVVKGHDEVLCVENASIRHGTGGFTGDAFIPHKIWSQFTEDVLPEQRNKMIAATSLIFEYPNAMGRIYTFKESKEVSKHLRIGREAFDSYNSYSTEMEKEETVETCALMGYSAAISVFDGRFDCRSFLISNVRRIKKVVKFDIDNPQKRPTESVWVTSRRIKFGGSFGEVNAVIETVVKDDIKKVLTITARLDRGTPKSIHFDSGVIVVSQRESQKVKTLNGGFFSKLAKNSNGRRVIETLYGGEPLEPLEDVEPRHFYFPDKNEMLLDEDQARYVEGVLAAAPLLVGTSPSGSGKSITLVTTALEVHKKSPGSRQLLLCQSNYATVNLVDIARRVCGADAPKFLRFVSENNWKELNEDCLTPWDYPQLLKEVAIEWAKSQWSHRQNEEKTGTLSYKQALDLVFYLLDRNLLAPKEMKGRALRIYNENKDRVKKPWHYNLMKAFFILYDANVILATADSVRGLAEHLEEVTTIQIDEASQLPEYTLLYLLSTFPNANFGLVGDAKQLPPFSDEELDGNLEEFGIGETLNLVTSKELFPIVEFNHFYRCHPKTTELLSRLFYEGKVKSGVTAKERDSFMRHRTDIWPNYAYPIAIVNNVGHSEKSGTSYTNGNEKRIVKRLVSELLKPFNGYQLRAKDIGVISFYAAQAGELQAAIKGSKVKCGTVDVFQGTEREVIILCCTAERSSKFMTSNRLNAALSRARQATIIIGNVGGLERTNKKEFVPFWTEIISIVRKNGCLMETNRYPYDIKEEPVFEEKKDKK